MAPTTSSHLSFTLLIFILLTSVILISCQPKSQNSTEPQGVEVEKELLAQQGEALFNAYCFSCHSDFTPEENKIAPSTAAIQKSYKEKFPVKESFKSGMISFLQSPSADAALMKDAVARYGLMPKLAYSEQDLDAMTEYIFDAQFGQSGQKNTTVVSEIDLTNMSPSEKGLHYANTTKALLGKNLMAKIQSEGTAGALAFCNVKAIPFTDSMATHHGVSIKRVTDQPRNPDNLANNAELNIIKQWKADMANNASVEPVLLTSADGVYSFYAPITTNAMCLQCHGSSDQISPETLGSIKTLYPNDKALGYEDNALRGIWSIRW